LSLSFHLRNELETQSPEQNFSLNNSDLNKKSFIPIYFPPYYYPIKSYSSIFFQQLYINKPHKTFGPLVFENNPLKTLKFCFNQFQLNLKPIAITSIVSDEKRDFDLEIPFFMFEKLRQNKMKNRKQSKKYNVLLIK